MAELPTVGGDNGTWGEILNEFLGVSIDPDGTLSPAAVAEAIGPSGVTPGTYGGPSAVPEITVSEEGFITTASQTPVGFLPNSGTAGAPTSGTWTAGREAVDVTGRVWVCTVGGTPGTWALNGTFASLGDTSPQSFAGEIEAPQFHALLGTGGTNNEAFGASAGQALMSGSSNALFGALAGQELTSGNSNAAFGYNALGRATLASGNTAIGTNALSLWGEGNQSGGNNTAVGQNALEACLSGISNVAVGATCATALSTGNGNTAVGTTALDLSTTSSNLCAFGFAALGYAQALSGSSAFGYNALGQTTTGDYNNAFGYNALGGGNPLVLVSGCAVTNGSPSVTVVSGGFPGVADGMFVHGADIPYGTTVLNVSGNTLTMSANAIGTPTVQQLTFFNAMTGQANDGHGYEAGALITTGSFNCLFGYGSGYIPGNTTHHTVTGSYNTALGYETGAADGTDPSGYTAIGASAVATTNATALGYKASASAAGAVAIGCDHTGGAASSSVEDQFVLGTSNHAVVIPGTFTVESASSAPLLAAAPPRATFANPSAPTGTTSTVRVMAGLAVAFTPTATGKVMAYIVGNIATAVAAANVTVEGYYGTGTAPVNVNTTISAVTNATNPEITCASTAGMFIGQSVAIANVGGATGVNGTQTVASVIDGTHFTITLGTAPGIYTSGGSVGAAPLGTAFPAGPLTFRPPTSAIPLPFTLLGTFTGLAIGTPTWWDIAFLTGSPADAATLTGIAIVIEECS